MADFQTKTSYMNCLWYQIETLKTFMFYTHDSPTFFFWELFSMRVVCVCVFLCGAKV